MPITVPVVEHAAAPWKDGSVDTAEKMLELACPKQWRRCQRVVQSSFQDTPLDSAAITPSENGFVWAGYRAYSHHHHLIIRPEDIWFAVLSQLSFYINAHAEELRSFFVAHDGKKTLEAISEVADFGRLALHMTDLLAKNVNDPALRDWVMPAFTTTTHHDKVVGAVLFMGAMQAYFKYKMTVCCGIPSVTLLGQKDDFKDILHRLDKIDLLGEEPRQFASMLRPILQHMVLTFETPTDPKVTSFWNRIVHHNAVGSGTDYLSGWLTAFCFWNDKGKSKRLNPGNALFDGVQYPYVGIDSVPVGFASVPVKVDNLGHKFDATMVAGSVGIAASSSNNSSGSASASRGLDQQTMLHNATASDDSSDLPNLDTIQPVSGWWMYETESTEAAAAREAEKQRLREQVDRINEKMMTMDHSEQMAFYDDEAFQRMLDTSQQLEELEAF